MEPAPLPGIVMPRQFQQALDIAELLVAARLGRQPGRVVRLIKQVFEALRKRAAPGAVPPAMKGQEKAGDFLRGGSGGGRIDFVKAVQRDPKRAGLGRGQPHGNEFIRVQPDQGRAQHRQQRDVLPGVVEQQEEADQIADLDRIKKSPAIGGQRNAGARKRAGVNLRLAGGGPQQHGHVAPLDRAQGLGGTIKDRRAGVFQFAQPGGGDAGFGLGVGQFFFGGGIRGVLRFFRRTAACGQAQAKLDPRLGIGRPGECGAAGGITKLKMRFGRIADAAHLLAEQRREAAIHKGQDCFVTAEVVRERQHPSLSGGGAPGAGVAQENIRPREAEAVDALLHIADEEAVRLRTFAADRGNDPVLGLVDVLVFIHVHHPQPVAPFAGDGSGLVRRVIPEQPERELFKIAEVEAGTLAFAGGEAFAKLMHEFEQGEHVRTGQCEIFRQRIAGCALRGRERSQHGGFFEHGQNGIAEFPLRAPRPKFVRALSGNLPQHGSEGVARGRCRQTGQPAGAAVRDFVFGWLRLQLRPPAGQSRVEFLHEQRFPSGWIKPRPRVGFAREPAGGIGQRLQMMMHGNHHVLNRLVGAATVQADQFQHGTRFGRGLIEVLIQHFPHGFGGEQAGLAFVEHLRLRIKPQLVEVIAHQPITEAVQRADARLIQQGQLLRQSLIGRLAGRPIGQGFADAPPHLRRRRFGEGHHQ